MPKFSYIPFTRKILTNKELLIIDKLFNKLADGYKRDHKNGKCKILDCNVHYFLAEGKIEHYPNGYYIE